MTALQIAALKRLGKGNKILVLDRSGGSTAKAVARALAERGFGRVFVIKGGFQVGLGGVVCLGWVAVVVSSVGEALLWPRACDQGRLPGGPVYCYLPPLCSGAVLWLPAGCDTCSAALPRLPSCITQVSATPAHPQPQPQPPAACLLTGARRAGSRASCVSRRPAL